MKYNQEALSAIQGLTIKEISGLEQGSDEVRILFTSGEECVFYHAQDCCEYVDLHDFESDSDDYSGAKVLNAEEVNSSNEPPPREKYIDSYTWTFYKIETTKGGIWMRWLGESNGYYSESVDVRFE